MAAAHPLTSHDEIRRWAEERNAKPACVRGTGGKGDTGMIRLDFPGFTGAQKLQPISWREWFKSFDENNLALLVQDQTARGDRSNFNKLVGRKTAEGKQRSRRSARAGASRTRTAGARKSTARRKTASAASSRRAGAAKSRKTASKTTRRSASSTRTRRTGAARSAATRRKSTRSAQRTRRASASSR